VGINLDAASVRAEMRERGTFTEKQAEGIEALTDEEIDTAIREVVGDYFWEAYDSTRSDAIQRLMEAHDLGDEGEDEEDD
jgi:hypothetical protein